MYLKMNLDRLISILNWLFILFPISFIAGNSIINLHFLIFVLFGCIYLKKKNIKFQFDFLLLLFLIFCATLIISSILNDFNITKSFLYLRFLVFYFICYFLLKEKKFNLDKVFYYYAIFVSIISADLIIQHALGYNIVGLKIQNFGTIRSAVATSFFIDEQIAGSFVQNFGFYSAFIIFYKFREKKFKNVIIKSFLLSLISISILISFQRAPMIIWSFFLIVYGIIYYKSKLIPVLLSFVILSVFILNFSSKQLIESYKSFSGNAIGLFGGESIPEKTLKNYRILKDKKKYEEVKKNLTLSKSHYESGSGHASLFANSIYIWEDSPILGIGYKNFYNKCTEKKLTRCSTHPHNFYLDVLVTTGMAGLIILILYIFILFLKVFYSLKINIKIKNEKKIHILLIALINFLMFFFPFKTSGSFFTTSSATYMIITLVVLLSQLKKNNLKNNFLKYF